MIHGTGFSAMSFPHTIHIGADAAASSCSFNSMVWLQPWGQNHRHIKTYVCFLTCSETVLSRQLNLWNAFDAISIVYPRGVAIADNFRRACGVRRQPETRCGELSMQRSIWSPPSRSVHGELTTASWFSSTSGVNPQVPCRMDKHLKCVS